MSGFEGSWVSLTPVQVLNLKKLYLNLSLWNCTLILMQVMMWVHVWVQREIKCPFQSPQSCAMGSPWQYGKPIMLAAYPKLGCPHQLTFTLLFGSLSLFLLSRSPHKYLSDFLLEYNLCLQTLFKFPHCPTLGIRRQKLNFILLLDDKPSLCHSCGQSLLLTVQIRPLCYAVDGLTPETID